MKGRYPKARDAMKARGEEISKASASGICAYRQPDLAWVMRVSMPFSYAASKNHVWTKKDRDHVRSRARSNAYRAELTELIRESIPCQIVSNKLWIDIFVQKPDHKGDAVNVVDMVCDAVKDATGLDDRWYALRAVDWEIVKGGGRLFVGVGQELVENAQACATCGRILQFGMFANNRTLKNGVSRVCNDCRRSRCTC